MDYSTVVTFAPDFFPGAGAFFDTATMIMSFILLGKLLDAVAKGRTSEAIRKIMGLQAKTARVIRNGEEQEIPVEDVQVDDIVVVRPGEKIPVDGTVTEGYRQWTRKSSRAKASQSKKETATKPSKTNEQDGYAKVQNHQGRQRHSSCPNHKHG